ncbi:GNAT family N-acetyltransferase [Roseateles sp.]|jgi:hypothetical protein|uniref:GNAT family N-acetyltransferase n=1 Tax=Roseateles sp. TaxID=1971397 RepID=UPI0037C5EE7B
MNTTRTSTQPLLFQTADLQARELTEAELPELQAFYDANPFYFQTINGHPAGPDDARIDFEERPPAHMSFSRQWFIGLRLHEQPDAPLGGVAIVVSDLVARQVWHLSLFLIATPLHGQGIAAPAYQALESWVSGQGARWLRLGVVQGNARAEAFWARQGYAELRTREGVDTGGRINTLSVRLKPLQAGAGLDDYLRLAPRDQPGSNLP